MSGSAVCYVYMEVGSACH